jgi:2-oxoisovalerate dehydrogenase E2 component (dihydrolipoyl transacylase)
VGTEIIHIDASNNTIALVNIEDIAITNETFIPPSQPESQFKSKEVRQEITDMATSQPSASHRPAASPAVRRRALEQGIDLSNISGSGAGGRITQSDLEVQGHGGSSGPAVPHAIASNDLRFAANTTEEVIPVLGLRRKIAQKMQEAKRHIPHFTYVEEIDVTELEELRTRLNTQYGATRGRLTLLPFLMRAMVLAIRNHPEVNARYDDDSNQLTRFGAVHLGLATQTSGGLMVPVIRHTETLDLWASAAAVLRASDGARSGKAAREDLSGSTITLTSLGALGGIVSTPVINYPEVAIVGTNRIVERPMIKCGQVIARKMMNLSSSFDHRVVDGMNAAEFIQEIRGYLECPGTLLV